MKEIIKTQQQDLFLQLKDEDFEDYLSNALSLGVKEHEYREVIDLYKSYCKFLYKNSQFDKCTGMIENLLDNFSLQLNEEDSVTFKEILILSKNNIDTSLHDQVDEELKELLIKEKNISQLIETFISYNFSYITDFELEKLQINFNFLFSFSKEQGFPIFSKKEILAELNNFIGNLFFYNGYYNHAKRHFFVSLREEIHEGVSEKLLKFNNNIALSFYELGYMDKAMKYFNIIEKSMNDLEDDKLLHYIYGNIGLLYLRTEKYSLAFAVAEKSLAYKKSINDISGFYFSIVRYITILMDKKPAKAKKYFNELTNLIKLFPNKIYNLYYLAWEKYFYNKNTLTEIYRELLSLDYYPLTLIPLLSIMMKSFPKLTNQYFFSLFMVKLMNHQLKELGNNNFNHFYRSFSEHENIFSYYTINSKDYMIPDLSKQQIPFVKKTRIEGIIKYPEKEIKSRTLNENEILFLLFLKSYKKGNFIYHKTIYSFNTEFEKKVSKRIDFLQRYYIKNFIISKN